PVQVGLAGEGLADARGGTVDVGLQPVDALDIAAAEVVGAGEPVLEPADEPDVVLPGSAGEGVEVVLGQLDGAVGDTVQPQQHAAAEEPRLDVGGQVDAAELAERQVRSAVAGVHGGVQPPDEGGAGGAAVVEGGPVDGGAEGVAAGVAAAGEHRVQFGDG